MRDGNEAAFLRAIADRPDDNFGRLVYADWLEERGEIARSEFLRVQCELSSADPSADRRQALRLRERALLDAHRHEWVQAIGLPIEDVDFVRGLISRMRLSAWDDGRLVDAAYSPRLASVEELDLSGLAIGDAGLIAFAEKAHLPALRKLILSDNAITNAGVTAFANAAGLRGLDTLFLSGNPSTEGDGVWHARAALENAAHFRLGSLDLGERADGYCMSAGEAELARRRQTREHLLPFVSRYFKDHERLQSAMICVAQYWNDEADDAVHGLLIVSELFEPTLEGVTWLWDDEPNSDMNVPNTQIRGEYGETGSACGLGYTLWDSNSRAIPVWAAYAPEGGSQEYEFFKEAYAPAVIFYRHGGYEFLPPCRPHLDGICPEWGWEE